MKSCTIYGDMSSDKSSENYPTVAICDECVAADQASGENSQIVTVSNHDMSDGDTCAFCDKTLEEEQEEQL